LPVFGALADWGKVTTDDLDPTSARWAGLVWSGTGVLVFAVVALVSACVLLAFRLARRKTAGSSEPSP
jgi:hypothetical protein